MNVEFDELDLKIIQELKDNSRRSNREIARKLGVSASTLIQRIEKLEKKGIIKGYSVTLNHSLLGRDLIAVIEITISKAALLKVQEQIAVIDGVAAVYDVTGEFDSIAIVRAKNRNDLSNIVKKIHGMHDVSRTNTHIALNVVKEFE